MLNILKPTEASGCLGVGGGRSLLWHIIGVSFVVIFLIKITIFHIWREWINNKKVCQILSWIIFTFLMEASPLACVCTGWEGWAVESVSHQSGPRVRAELLSKHWTADSVTSSPDSTTRIWNKVFLKFFSFYKKKYKAHNTRHKMDSIFNTVTNASSLITKTVKVSKSSNTKVDHIFSITCNIRYI